MRIYRIFLLSFLCCLCGCVSTGQSDFMTVCQNHYDLVMETNDALIASIHDEIQRTPDNRLEDVNALNDLIERLLMIQKQSELIYKYTIHQADQTMIAKMIEHQWRSVK